MQHNFPEERDTPVNMPIAG